MLVRRFTKSYVKLSLLVGTALGMTALFAWGINEIEDEIWRILVAAVTIFFVIASLGLFYLLVFGRPFLDVSDDGIHSDQLAPDLIPWSDIESVDQRALYELGFRFHRSIILRFTRPIPIPWGPLGRIFPILLRWKRSKASIVTDVLNGSFNEIYEAIQRAYEQYRT